MALSKRYEHDGLYLKYDMDKPEIHIGTGIVKVHDIFNPLPDFMMQADCIFSDPPCNRGNLRSFYTKEEIEQQNKEFSDFQNRFFECVDQIKPRILVLETFKSNHEAFLSEVQKRYQRVKVYNSMYYRNPKNHCYIIVASNDEIKPSFDVIDGMDEEDVIEWICTHVEFSCIGDLCIGKGLVGFYANKFGRRFVGTELNKKRLAVLLWKNSHGQGVDDVQRLASSKVFPYSLRKGALVAVDLDLQLVLCVAGHLFKGISGVHQG